MKPFVMSSFWKKNKSYWYNEILKFHAHETQRAFFFSTNLDSGLNLPQKLFCNHFQILPGCKSYKAHNRD